MRKASSIWQMKVNVLIMSLSSVGSFATITAGSMVDSITFAVSFKDLFT